MQDKLGQALTAGGPVTTYGESDAVWSSVDGRHWTHDAVPARSAAFDSLAVTPAGFRLRGLLRTTEKPVAWTSTDGVVWSTRA